MFLPNQFQQSLHEQPHGPRCWDSYGPHQHQRYPPPSHRRSLSPAQLAAINDYNEKLRVYRLDQAALLARLNAWFEENIDDENLAEENTDNTPTMVVGEDVPNNTVNNDDATVVVPNDESFEEIVKNDNMSPHMLVEIYDDKGGDLVDPTHGELEIRDDVETLLEENVVGYEEITVLIKSLANGNIGATQINGKSLRSTTMFTCIIESWCRSSKQSLFHYQQRPCTFDPGGEASVMDYLHCFVTPTLRTRWISTVGELIRAHI